MLVNVCSSPSSGSTFLADLLDRHPAVACGDELKLFSNAVLYDDYPRFKRWHRWFRFMGMSGRPYHEHRIIVDNLDRYRLTPRIFHRWAAEARDFRALVGRLRDHVLHLTNKTVWAEKTPRNILVVGKFLKRFPDGKVVHIVRDPRDMICSLAGKKHSTDFVGIAATWVASTAAVQPHRGDPRVLEIRYEDLCMTPDRTMAAVCRFIGVEFDMKHFAEDSTTRSAALTRWAGPSDWAGRPAGGFSTRSVGRHRHSGVDWSFLPSLRLTAEYARVLGARTWTAAELAGEYGYCLPASAAGADRAPVRLPVDRRRSRFERWWFRAFDRWVGMSDYVAACEAAATTMFSTLRIAPGSEVRDLLKRPLPISTGKAIKGILK